MTNEFYKALKEAFVTATREALETGGQGPQGLAVMEAMNFENSQRLTREISGSKMWF